MSAPDAMEIDPVQAEAAALLQRRVDPLTYVNAFLRENIRPDSRGFKTYRKLNITCGSITSAYGSAMVRCGNTSVVCAVRGELVKRLNEDIPALGRVDISARVGPLCSSSFHTGRRGPTDVENTLTAFTRQIFTPSTTKSKPPVPIEQLTVLDGAYAWVLYLDVYHVGYDGNLTDPAVIAILAALRNTRLPTVVLQNEEVYVTRDNNVPVTIDYFPIPLTMALVQDGKVLVDPTADEEAVASAMVTVVTAPDGKVVAVRKYGGSSISETELLLCMDYSYQRVDKVIIAIETAAENAAAR